MKFFILIFFVFSFNSLSHTLEVIGPCAGEAVFKSPPTLGRPGMSLGEFSVEVLKTHHQAFVGSQEGIASIHNSPIGDAALEVLGDTQMRAYGWCVSVDGKEPDQTIDQVILSNPESKIVWFYAWALYDSGVWKDYCSPSWKLHSPFICGP